MQNKAAVIDNMDGFKVVATFFALWLTVYFDSTTETWLAYTLIFSIGILHGSNDIQLLQLAQGKGNIKSSRWLMIYVAVILLCIVFFLIDARVALLVFIVFSAYHFGEQHWHEILQNSIWPIRVFYSIYGLLILNLLFYNHSEEVNQIIFEMTGYEIPGMLYTYLVLGTLAIVILGIVFLGYRNEIKHTRVLKELFLLGLFYLIFFNASLIWAFSIYFIVWHSIPSIQEQTGLMYSGFSKENLIKYMKSAGLYWFLSVTALVLFILIVDNQLFSYMTLFFAFLAAITLPHVLVMSKLYKETDI
ncbi:Brp/Blh family beta-carotene 15,15'-dioxygenase [Croceiramulus getboli]|nr:Brp/Blh family beta-carotene 15,15'-dioxygenase [Flavobacteriaceae bacterium YJPT1-3]